MWIRWMMAAFIFNGLCTFGIRILAAKGLAGQYTSTYLFLWYLAGAAVLGAVCRRNKLHASTFDRLIGAALGLFSFSGQTSIGYALAGGLPGAVVYPISLGGGLFIVVATGVFFFRERVGPFGIAGIALGIFAIVLLSL